MRVLIDTNILISAALSEKGTAAKAFYKATESPYECILCDYCIDEFKRVARSRLSKYITNIDAFLASALISAKIISTPLDEECVGEEASIRDINDRPIVRAAINAKIDLILTGDKDFLQSGLKKPKMVSPAEFLQL